MDTVLLIVEHAGLRQRLEFRQAEISLGRGTGNDVVLRDADVARQHCMLYWHDGKLFIKDLKSTGGILLKGKRIVGPTQLVPGDALRMGRYVVSIESLGQPTQAPPRLPGLTLVVTSSRGDPPRRETHAVSPISIGMDRAATISLDDDTLARRHIYLRWETDGWLLDGCGREGICINHLPIKAVAALQAGDRFSFGQWTFEVTAVERPDGA